MDKKQIRSIRVLPNSNNQGMETLEKFKQFVTKVMVARGGYYYFPGQMMSNPVYALVLLQYAGMIRAVGVIEAAEKKLCNDETGNSYAGYYKFDVETLQYLTNPISAEDMRRVLQNENFRLGITKHNIDMRYMEKIFKLIEETR